MNVSDAAYDTVHSYPGGSESLAPRMGISASVLRGKVNQHNDRNRLALEEADEMMGKTRDYRILYALAGNHGFGLVRLDAMQPSETVLGTLLSANAAEGEFDRALQEALSDGVITPNELKTIDAAGAHQQAALIMLLSKLRSVTEGSR